MKYNEPLDLSNETSLKKIIGWIKPHSTVLEFGPASGKMTRYLKEQLQCKVYIVEIDTTFFDCAIRYAEDGILGNIDEGGWLQKFADIQFDYVVFADVLEHLYNPLSALQKSILLLKDDGSVLVSLPNLAHSDILINLYNNKFQYTEEGLLDETHIRFFSYESIDIFCQNAGLHPIEKDAVRIAPFCTEQKPKLDEISDELRVLMENRPYFNVYQFVYRLQKSEYAFKHGLRTPIQLVDEESAVNSKLYFDTGDGFGEGNALLLQPRKHNNIFVVAIQLPDHTRICRFDPLVGKACLITQISIFLDGQQVQPSFHNGIVFEENTYFCTKETSFIFGVESTAKRNIYIEYILREATEYDFLHFKAINHFFQRTNDCETENHLLSDKIETLHDEIQTKNEQVYKLSGKIEILHDEIQTKNEQVYQLKKNKLALQDELDDQYAEAKRVECELQLLKNDLEEMCNAYRVISQSRFWKITAPARKCLDAAKRIFRRNKEKLSAEDQVLDVIYSIDAKSYEGGYLTVRGWLFSPNVTLSKLQIVLSYSRGTYALDAMYGLMREDVYNAYKHDNAMHSGFFLQADVENLGSFDMYLRWFVGSETKQMRIGGFKVNSRSRFRYLSSNINKNNLKKLITYLMQGKLHLILDAIHRPRIKTGAEYDVKAINYRNFSSQYLTGSSEPINSFKLECVDIVLPVYNGYEYFDALFCSIPQTQVPYRLIIIDDHSSDPRVWEYLQNMASSDFRIILLHNDTNQGFVKTVNRGLCESKGHVVILNTDVELPEQWLERLIAPIMKEPMVASVTPFSNCATICSFPVFAQDNPLFEGLNHYDIDRAFRKLNPQYVELPTGVGFCMAMGRAAIDKVGIFDADSFARGYGEENDWCQRAIKMGYKNAIAENLFVYHKHGGSFPDEEKKRLIEQNGRMLLKKHPNYNQDVAKFCEADPLYSVRQYVIVQIINNMSDVTTWVTFDHSLGGGATAYLEKRLREAQRENTAAFIVRYHVHKQFYTLSFSFREYRVDFEFAVFSEMIDFLSSMRLQTIYVNELVSYPDLYSAFNQLCRLKEKCAARLIFFAHDYFAICPMINLVDHGGSYCGIPEDIHVCELCAKRNVNNHYQAYESIELWRSKWSWLLGQCEEIVVFSRDTRKKLENVYGSLGTIKVEPHQISYIPPFEKRIKTTDVYTIGLLGNMHFHKGLEILKDLIRIVEAEEQIRIVLIGTADSIQDSRNFYQTGAYRLEDLATLTLKHDIDIFFIPSIVPETFSYTTAEVMLMDLPIAVFNLGAPAERVKDYEKGIVIDEMNAGCALREIKAFLQSHSGQLAAPRKNQHKILFVIEAHSFASRYRVEHCIEELMFEGVTAELVTLNEIEKVNSFDNYQEIVIYRCPHTNSLERLIDACHREGIRVYFDIDDYVFMYEKIKDLLFLQANEYRAFETYCHRIDQSMQLCDEYIASTQALHQAIEEHFPNKPVHINRNVASLEMTALSLLAASEVSSHDNVVLGIFQRFKNTR